MRCGGSSRRKDDPGTFQIGEKYTGKVVSIQAFGAFVNLLPGKDGLLHISRVAKGRVDKVEDVLNIGDDVEVEVIDVDERGKVSLDRTDKPEAPPSSGVPREGGAPREGGHGGGGGGRDDRRPRRRQ